MAFTIEISGDRRSLLVGGDLLVGHAVEIRDRLLAALDLLEEVQLVIHKDSNLDLSFLQLICSLHREALQRGVKARTTKGWSETALRKMAVAGFLRRRCCRDCPDDACFFVPVGEAA